MEDRNFDKEASLELINSMINTAKGNLRQGAGKYFILWGYIVFLASVWHSLDFFWRIVDFSIQLPLRNGDIWLLAIPIGLAVTLVFIVRDRKNTLVKTYTDTIVNSVWGAFIVMLIVLPVILSIKGLDMAIYPVILSFYTLSLFISSKAYRFSWMYISVAISFLCLLSSIFLASSLYPLLMAIAILCGNIIPGHILNRIANKQHV